MLADPLEAFFAGLESGVARFFVALIAVLAGSAVCYCALASDGDWEDVISWLPLIVFVLFGWGSYGAWFFLGMTALFTMLVSLWFFVQDRHAKVSFFIGFTAATIYFLPTAFDQYRWARVLVIYSLCAASYWYIPYILAKRIRDA